MRKTEKWKREKEADKAWLNRESARERERIRDANCSACADKGNLWLQSSLRTRMYEWRATMRTHARHCRNRVSKVDGRSANSLVSPRSTLPLALFPLCRLFFSSSFSLFAAFLFTFLLISSLLISSSLHLLRGIKKARSRMLLCESRYVAYFGVLYLHPSDSPIEENY